MEVSRTLNRCDTSPIRPEYTGITEEINLTFIKRILGIVNSPSQTAAKTPACNLIYLIYSVLC